MQKQKTRMKSMTDVEAIISSAKLAHDKGNIAERDKICDQGIKELIRILTTKDTKVNTDVTFHKWATVYDSMADLHEIKGEHGMADLHRRNATSAKQHYIALMTIKRDGS